MLLQSKSSPQSIPGPRRLVQQRHDDDSSTGTIIADAEDEESRSESHHELTDDRELETPSRVKSRVPKSCQSANGQVHFYSVECGGWVASSLVRTARLYSSPTVPAVATAFGTAGCPTASLAVGAPYV